MNNSTEKRRRPLSMSTLLTLLIVGFVMCILAVCVTVFLGRYQSAVVQNARTSSLQAVAQAANTVNSYTEDMNDVMALITGTLADPDASADEFFAALMRVRTDVIAVTRYDARGALTNCWTLGGRAPKSVIVQNLSFDATLAAAGDSYLTAPHVETIFDGYYPWVVTMAERLPTAAKGNGWVALDLSFSGISSYISNVGIGAHGYCFLMDAAGNIVYHPQQQLIYSGLKQEETASLAVLADGSYDRGNVIYSLQTVPESSWRVVGVSYVDELITDNVAAMVRLAALIALAVLTVTVVCGVVLSRAVSRPLRGLSGAMRAFEGSAASFTYQPVHGTREVEDLSGSFGHMVVRVQELMDTVREEEINLRKTELKALQAQINPHFLYNTLDSIAWMCEQGRNEDAVHMVHALATLFRISISRGQEFIPISREVEHAKSYLEIQKYRYKNQFVYTFDVETGCEGYLCNKITLQPIIENAICHGLDLMVDEGRIDVRVFEDGGDVVFTVADNGVGMSAEQVAGMLRREPSDRTGIGIKNVNDRLRIYFGESYGLHIESELDVGTTVTIRMPKITDASAVGGKTS